jgi:hypothetical protein
MDGASQPDAPSPNPAGYHHHAVHAADYRVG